MNSTPSKFFYTILVLIIPSFFSLLLISLQENVTTYAVQFANSTETFDALASGYNVTNVTDTGFSPKIIIEPKTIGVDTFSEQILDNSPSFNETAEEISIFDDISDGGAEESLTFEGAVPESLSVDSFDGPRSDVSEDSLSIAAGLSDIYLNEPLDEIKDHGSNTTNEVIVIDLPPNLNKSSQEQVSGTLEKLNNDPRIENAELEEIYLAQYEEAQADCLTNESIKLAERKQIPTIGYDRIDGEILLEKIRNISTSNDIDIDIAILDSGINPHKDLNLYKEVYFKGDSPRDNCGHGTHVAGIAAAKDNDYGVVGVAPGAKLWNIKVLDKNMSKTETFKNLGLSSKAIETLENELKLNQCVADKASLKAGLDYVAEHADEIDVVNLSLGNLCDPNARILCNSPILDSAVKRVASKGIIVVAAAGNAGTDSKDWKPANLRDVLTVSNLNDSDGKCGGHGNITYRGNDDFLANTSNYGGPARISAPGVNVLSTNNTEGYSIYSGTSQATPLVTGAIALYKSINPDATIEDMEYEALDRSVQGFSECNGESFGYMLGGDKDNIPEPLLNVKDII